jgi:hypothetical protein
MISEKGMQLLGKLMDADIASVLDLALKIEEIADMS